MLRKPVIQSSAILVLFTNIVPVHSAENQTTTTPTCHGDYLLCENDAFNREWNVGTAAQNVTRSSDCQIQNSATAIAATDSSQTPGSTDTSNAESSDSNNNINSHNSDSNNNMLTGPCLAERNRILSKIHAAVTQGVGVEPYQLELDTVTKLLLDNSEGTEDALGRLRSLEDSLDKQLASKNTAGVQYGNLTVYTTPPVLSMREYDPSNPPGQIRNDGGFEGFTQWNIDPHVQVHWNNSSQVVSLATVTLTCNIVEWIPRGCCKKLKEHEAGHVKICASIYERGNVVTREIAQKYLMDRPWAGGATNAQFQQAYRQEITDLIAWLSNAYDIITNHGVNKVPSDAAVGQAFELCYQKFRPYLAAQNRR